MTCLRCPTALLMGPQVRDNRTVEGLVQGAGAVQGQPLGEEGVEGPLQRGEEVQEGNRQQRQSGSGPAVGVEG